MQKLELKVLMPNIYNVVDYDYASIKTDEYDAIIENILSNTKSSNTPSFKQVMGIPGTGKSSFIKLNKKNDDVFVGFDFIMEKIPEYQKDIKALGSVESFKKWEMPARVIGYELLRRSIEQNKNILFEHSGLIDSGVDLVNNVKKYNYNVEMFCIKCDLHEAIDRTQKREAITKRHTPKQMIEERSRKLNDFLAQYKKIANKLSVFDTTNHKFELIEEYFNKK